ncbi:MAG: hypothetical protein CR982_05075 [Candidatus Cloacimonadota bacterium]|nr:MAG: hypothetical protein CR982_05075 [Candidatus Cloacimonadota bacterium]PIE80540.1 MAG: hypothetical protein CSA15_01905 [Candidatus Delongbacteria bacterium]
MENFKNEIASRIYVDFEYVEGYEKILFQYNQMKKFVEESGLEGPILEAQKGIMNGLEERLNKKKNLVYTDFDNRNQDEDNLLKIGEFIEKFESKEKLYENFDRLNSIEKLESAIKDIELNSFLLNSIEDIVKGVREGWEEIFSKLVAFIKSRVEIEYFGAEPPKEEKEVVAEDEVAEEIEYKIQKSNMSDSEVKALLLNYLKVKELIFNKIIFDGKLPSLSIIDRIISISFKHGIGYVVNFISEPDTNYGKFYRNLLKVFTIIKEELYKEHNIVFVPEEGKNLSFLNSFYQNYLFVREKMDTIMTRYKLNESKLNDNFKIRNLIFDKSSGKYLVFYEGSISLSEGAVPYLKNQCRLGQMSFEIEFIPYEAPLIDKIVERNEKQLNKVDLSDENNYFKILSTTSSEDGDSVYIEMSGVKLLIDPVKYDPEFFERYGEPDVLIVTNARQKCVYDIPVLMNTFKDLRLFSSDITYKLLNVFWRREQTTQGILVSNENTQLFTRKDLEGFSERVIRITPLGKGYNFRGLVNIKFFNSGLVPGGAVVEIKDAKKSIAVMGDYSLYNSGLMKKTDLNIGNYDYMVLKGNSIKEFKPLKVDVEKIKRYLEDGKQVFIFSDILGNLQHLLQDLSFAGINYPIVSGSSMIDNINKEISKLVNFGSSWGDHIEDKTTFFSSINILESFKDEYEFYKKFSSEEPFIFILPFTKDEVEMVLKDKITKGCPVFICMDSIEKIKNVGDTILGKDNLNLELLNEYNYLERRCEDYTNRLLNEGSELKIYLTSDLFRENKRIVSLEPMKEVKVY